MKNVAKLLLLALVAFEVMSACSARGPHQESWNPGKPKKNHQEKKK